MPNQKRLRPPPPAPLMPQRLPPFAPRKWEWGKKRGWGEPKGLGEAGHPPIAREESSSRREPLCACQSRGQATLGRRPLSSRRATWDMGWGGRGVGLLIPSNLSDISPIPYSALISRRTICRAISPPRKCFEERRNSPAARPPPGRQSAEWARSVVGSGRRACLVYSLMRCGGHDHATAIDRRRSRAAGRESHHHSENRKLLKTGAGPKLASQRMFTLP